MGFADLLNGARSETGFYNVEGNLKTIQNLFEIAVKSEDENKMIDALFYYRYIFEIFHEKTSSLINNSTFTGLEIVLKAMNNIGGICYDLNQKSEAIIWFKDILSIDPDNEIAKENLEVLNREL
jgi:hypothetical protein